MKKGQLFLLVVLAFVAIIALFLSPFASKDPDGLDKVAEEQGFDSRGKHGDFWEGVPAPEYKVRGVRNERLATSLAGLLGTLVTFGVALAIGKLLASRKKTTSPSNGDAR